MIYFLEAPTISRLKIGRTGDLKKRLEIIRTACPVDTKLFGVMRNYPYESNVLEMSIHRYFRNRRQKGEWFDYDQSILDEIRSWPYFVHSAIIEDEFDIGRKSITRAQKRELISLLELGMGRRKIAERVGVSVYVVDRIRTRWEVSV